VELINLSPFAAEHTVMMDGTGIERLLVVVKASYSLARGTPVIAEEQEPVVRADPSKTTSVPNARAREERSAQLRRPGLEAQASLHAHRRRRSGQVRGQGR
jgi:hypothetical protein